MEYDVSADVLFIQHKKSLKIPKE